MRDAKTQDAQAIGETSAEPTSRLAALEASLKGGGPDEAIGRLIEDLEAAGNYRLLLDALLLKARRELGLPLIQVGRLNDLPEPARSMFEERYVEALRHVGGRLLESDDVPGAWPYFQAIGEPGPVAEALDRLQPPDDPDRVARVIEIAFHQGANITRGFDLILENYGACSAITSLEQLAPADETIRAACVERLIRHLHAQLSDNLRHDIARRGQPRPPEEASIAELVADRDWLFGDEAYHIDVSHLSTVVRWSAMATDPEAVDLAIDLTEYGRRLSPRLQYEGTPPFDRVFDDHRLFLKAIRGRDVDEGIDHFRAKLAAVESSPDDPESTLPAQVLVNLLMRLERWDEAIDIAESALASIPEAMLVCPPIAELCQRAGRMDRLAEIAGRTDQPVHYLAARIQAEAAS